jgi:hypothetical protein
MKLSIETRTLDGMALNGALKQQGLPELELVALDGKELAAGKALIDLELGGDDKRFTLQFGHVYDNSGNSAIERVREQQKVAVLLLNQFLALLGAKTVQHPQFQ